MVEHGVTSPENNAFYIVLKGDTQLQVPDPIARGVIEKQETKVVESVQDVVEEV